MKSIVRASLVLSLTILLSACATVGGTAVGAGIGSLSGETKAGALTGGGVGLLYDFL
jgi:hypothetical protein